MHSLQHATSVVRLSKTRQVVSLSVPAHRAMGLFRMQLQREPIPTVIKTQLIYEIDGEPFITSGQWSRQRPYTLTCHPVWTVESPSGPTRRIVQPFRLAERARRGLKAFVRLEWVAGPPCSVWMEGISDEIKLPAFWHKNSVAFDAVTDAQEVGGDGVLSLSHTASGSNRAVFAGVGFDSSSPASTSCTYGVTSMTEMWDLAFGTFFGNAGYQLAGDGNVATGAQTVTSTVAGIETNHALGVISMTGVDGAIPVGTPQTNSATGVDNISVTVTGVGVDDLVVDNLYVSNAASDDWTAGADQTERYSEFLSASERFKGSTQLGSNGGVMSWSSISTATQVSLGAVAFKPRVETGPGWYQSRGGWW